MKNNVKESLINSLQLIDYKEYIERNCDYTYGEVEETEGEFTLTLELNGEKYTLFSDVLLRYTYDDDIILQDIRIIGIDIIKNEGEWHSEFYTIEDFDPHILIGLLD